MSFEIKPATKGIPDACDIIIVLSRHVEKLAEYKARQNILLKNIESIEDAIFLISREVTRRYVDTKGDNRNANLG